MSTATSQGSIWSSTTSSGRQANNPASDDQTGKKTTSINFDEFTAIQRNLVAEEDVRPSIKGVVSVTIKKTNFSQAESFVNYHKYVYCEISTRTYVKKTTVVQSNKLEAEWNERKHFPVTVTRNRRHPFNLLKIQVFSVDTGDLDQPMASGSVFFHLHDVIPVSPITGTYDLWDDDLLVGEIQLEITFNYGAFGYGYSIQLQEENMSPDDLIRYSLFPRLTPQVAEMEAETSVLVVKAVPHPSYIPFKSRVNLSYGKEIGDALNGLVRSHVPAFLQGEMEDIVDTRERYHSINDRSARLLELHKQLSASSAPEETIPTVVDPIDDPLPYRSYVQYVKPILSFNPPKGVDDFLAVARRKISAAFELDTAETVKGRRFSTLQKLTGSGKKDNRKVHPI